MPTTNFNVDEQFTDRRQAYLSQGFQTFSLTDRLTVVLPTASAITDRVRVLPTSSVELDTHTHTLTLRPCQQWQQYATPSNIN